MRVGYKKLGDYIRTVDVRNTDLEVDTLLGVSITKMFIPSIANTVGTDMSRYKIIEKGQFAYGTVTSRNGDKISIAHLNEHAKALVSQVYIVFEVIDENELLPEYLMMWFSRPEFDRYARFRSHGSTRETFDWEEMCEVELPIPSIEKQREIVIEYQAVEKKIKTNEAICEKLEETAQTLYKHWFVDFEFPDENGNPYKSSGGKMVYNEELDKEIPEGWEVVTVNEFCDEMKNGATPSRTNILYWNSNDIPWIKTGEVSNNIIFEAEEYISELGFKKSSTKLIPKDSVLMAMYGATAAQLAYLKFETTTNQACCAMICSNKEKSAYLFHALLYQQKEIENQAIGGAQPNLSKGLIEEIKLLQPKNIENLGIEVFSKIIELKASKTLEIIKLSQLQELLLSRMAGVDKELVN